MQQGPSFGVAFVFMGLVGTFAGMSVSDLPIQPVDATLCRKCHCLTKIVLNQGNSQSVKRR
jgi:hypothetical protein